MCGGRGLIKHQGFLIRGRDKRHIDSITSVFSGQPFICVMQVCFKDEVEWLHICPFVSERG